jgi:hypothetical protein
MDNEITSQLTPGVRYIYEKVNGHTYARPFGEPASKRVLIGIDQERQDLHAQLREDKLWGNIRRAAKTNPALQEALETAIMIYNLTRHE